LSDALRVRAFAKINLGLKVLGPRHDGYHELRTIYQTVALSDRLEVSLASRRGSIELDCVHGEVPPGRGNLVYRAAELWRQARSTQRGIRLRLNKRIPSRSGLGGGSSDAAATLMALERLATPRLAPHRLAALAARVGSDAPLFIYGGRVLGCGRGEEIYPLPDLPSRLCLIVFPEFTVSTAGAYRELSLRLTQSGEWPRISEFGARPHFPLDQWGPAENDFEQVVFARWPGLAQLKRQFIQAGAETASLTGSGSALYAVFDSAEKLLRAAGRVPPEWKLFRTRTLSRREYWRRLFAR
jgi:4-diphosphocytidyl-2-C-methyl-D-erythritol kinase